MSLRPTKAAPVASVSDSSSDTTEPDEDRQPLQVQTDQAQAQPSISQRALSQTLTSTANLANLLPTGTLLAFQLLIPVFTNNGSCDAATRPMTSILLLLFALSCFVASFTDSVKASNGQVYYGIATPKGLFLFEYPAAAGLPDLSKYKLRFMDLVHALLSVLVFGAVAFRDKNVLGCLYPMPAHETQEVLDIVPIGIGLLCSLLFVVFPTTRHGIGYPLSPGKS
ncbi:protein DMP3-like [Rosa rugosa]|uniref:protein DMP3-like n=1 Tax=Rosa rugosa TaxID=74645 RepID=UPI002B40C9E5|nr:protein DMP3-like [Rosa rugosa]